MQLKGIITLLAVLFMLPLSIDAKKENNGGDGSTDRRYQYFFIEAMRQQSIKMLSLFNRMIAASPEETDIRELEVAYMKMKKFPTAAIDSTLLSLLSIAPDNASARFQLLQNKWSSEDWDSIIALSEPGTQYNPEEMVFYYFTGLAYYQKGEDDKALSFFQKGVAEINDESSSDIVSDFYSIMGDILFKKGKAMEAFAAYDSCLQWKPDNISCLNNYA